MINYVMIFALVLFVVGLSLPTLISLTALFKEPAPETPARLIDFSS